MNLCRFSRSAIFRDSILLECPLALTANAAKKCPCKRRTHVTQPVETRVSVCNHPLDWRGKPFNAAAHFAKSASFKPEADMSTTATEEPKAAVRPVGQTSTALTTIPAQDNTAITIYDKITDLPKFLGAMSDDIFKSGLIKGCSPALAGVLALECVARKQTFLQLVQTFHVIQGRLSIRADAALAEFNRMGGKHQLIEKTENRAAAKFTWEKKTYDFSLTWDEAKTAPWCYGTDGKLKDNWAHPMGRKAMLWARMVSDAVRTICPSVNCGRYTPEEIADFGNADDPMVVLQEADRQVAAAQAVEKAQSAAAEAGFVDAEFTVKEVETPKAEVKEETKVEPKAEAKAEPKPEETPPFDFTPITVEAEPKSPPPAPSPLEESPEAERERMKTQLTEIKTALGIVKADWLKALAKYNVKSALDMDNTQMANLLLDLKPAYEKFKGGQEWQRWFQANLGK